MNFLDYFKHDYYHNYFGKDKYSDYDFSTSKNVLNSTEEERTFDLHLKFMSMIELVSEEVEDVKIKDIEKIDIIFSVGENSFISDSEDGKIGTVYMGSGGPGIFQIDPSKVKRVIY